MSETQFIPVDLNPAATEDAVRNAPDSFIDDQFAPLDLRNGPQGMADALVPIAEEHPELMPVEEAATASAAPATPPAAPPQPEVHEYDDGSTVTIEKTNKGWRATLDSGGKAPEVFYGRTKDELLSSVLAAKLHATRHIRDLNKKLKLTARPAAAAPVVIPPQPRVRQLTADEVFEVKNLLTTNPDLAFDTLFQKKTGLTLEQLVGLLEKGQHAKDELDSEAVAKTFMQAHPDYYADPEWKNYATLVGYLSKSRLGETLTPNNHDDIMRKLIRGGHWTVENLDEAWEEMADELESAPRADEILEEEVPTPVLAAPIIPAQSAPVPAATPASDPRIAGRRVGQRAGLGIRASQTTTVPVETTRSPSADESFDNLSDQEITDLFSGVRRAAAQSARR